MKRRPTTISGLVASALGILDTRLLHIGIPADEWLILVAATVGVVGYFTPR